MGIRQRVSAWRIVRYLIAVGALAWVLRTVSWRRPLVLLGEIPPTILLVVVVLGIIGEIPRVWMWSTLLAHFQPVRFHDVLRADLVVTFVNTLFPSRFSGRSAAPVIFKHFTGVSWAHATAVTGMHTGLYAVWYAIACLGGLALLASRLSPGVLVLLGASTVVYVVVAAVVVFGGKRLNRIESLLERLTAFVARTPIVGDRIRSLVSGVPEVLSRSSAGFRTVSHDGRAISRFSIAWVLALVVVPGVRVYLLFVGFGVSPETPVLLPLYLITGYAVTVLPLTPGGVGVAEATSTLVFLSLGYPSAVVVPVVILDRLLGSYLPALAGWYPAVTTDFGDIRADA